jgi:hypothetical protein
VEQVVDQAILEEVEEQVVIVLHFLVEQKLH